jgi:hypothetical protein
LSYRTIHPQFKDTFSLYGGVPEGVQVSLWNYLAYGLEPGSFVRAVLENNFLMAATRADHVSEQCLKSLAIWVINKMPYGSHGNAEAMQSWMAKTDEERLDIMIEMRLRPGVIDILRGVAVT